MLRNRDGYGADGRRLYWLDMGGDSAPAPAPAPDYSSVAASNEAAAKIAAQSAAEDLAFRKTQYEDAKPQQQALVDLATKVAQQQLADSQQSSGQAKAQWDAYTGTYKPIEQQSALESMGGLEMSPDQVRAMATRLGMDPDKALAVMQGVQGSNENAATQAETAARADANNVYAQGIRGLSRLGGDPAKLASAAAALAGQQTATTVGGMNTARNIAKNQGISLRAGTAAFGRNMPNTANQTIGVGTTAGNSAVSNANTGAQSYLPGATYVSGAVPNQINAAQLGINSNLGLANLQSSNYNSQLQYQAGVNAANAQSGAGLGSALGTLGGVALNYALRSDNRLKRNVIRIGKTARGFGLYVWDWVWGGAGMGVIAQEVERTMPEAVITGADGWKRVNYALVG